MDAPQIRLDFLRSKLNDLKNIAKEQVTIEFKLGYVLVLGSEVATLRLLKHYRHCYLAHQGYGDEYESYYFTIEGSEL